MKFSKQLNTCEICGLEFLAPTVDWRSLRRISVLHYISIAEMTGT